SDVCSSDLDAAHGGGLSDAAASGRTLQQRAAVGIGCFLARVSHADLVDAYPALPPSGSASSYHRPCCPEISTCALRRSVATTGAEKSGAWRASTEGLCTIAGMPAASAVPTASAAENRTSFRTEMKLRMACVPQGIGGGLRAGWQRRADVVRGGPGPARTGRAGAGAVRDGWFPDRRSSVRWRCRRGSGHCLPGVP